MARAIDVEKAIEIIEEKQKELCPVGRYGRNYVYGSDREKYDAWEEIIDALDNLPTLTPPNEPLSIEQLREMYQKEKAVCHAVQAELENYRKGHCAEGGCAAEKDRDAVLAELERVKRERDAAVEDLHKLCPAWKWDGQKED